MRLLIRADASAEIGVGHVMRCLALAQAWQGAGGEAILAAAEMPRSVAARLTREGLRLRPLEAATGSPADARATLAAARDEQVDWLVLDGYRFDLPFQQTVAGGEAKVLLIDDGAAPREMDADLLVNQNLFARPSLYAPAGNSCEMLLGPRYALLRREFQGARRRPAETDTEIRRLLVTLGGGRPPAALRAIVDATAASRLADREVILVVGFSPADEGSLQDLAGRPGLTLVHQPDDMAALMSGVDLAVSAAGSTTWELACLGVPALVVAVAENQVPVATALGQAGIALDLGRLEELDTARLRAELDGLAADSGRRAALSAAGRTAVDGRGAQRVVRSMRRGPLRLRGARREDAELLLRWRNEPTVRALAFDSTPISWETHVRWLEKRLADPGCRIFIALDEAGNAVGQVRFEAEGEEAEIHLSIAAEQRGRGWGSRLIRLATEEYSRSAGIRRVRALVKPDNVASLKAFAAAGYEPRGRDTVRGLSACRLLWQRTV